MKIQFTANGDVPGTNLSQSGAMGLWKDWKKRE